jgi:hypothetical protein
MFFVLFVVKSISLPSMFHNRERLKSDVELVQKPFPPTE